MRVLRLGVACGDPGSVAGLASLVKTCKDEHGITRGHKHV